MEKPIQQKQKAGIVTSLNDTTLTKVTIPDDRGYLRFRVFTSRHNLGQSGNSKIPDRLGFSRHMKTRLYGNAENSNWMTRK